MSNTNALMLRNDKKTTTKKAHQSSISTLNWTLGVFLEHMAFSGRKSVDLGEGRSAEEGQG